MGKAARIRKERRDAEGREYLTRAQHKAMNKEVSRQAAVMTDQFFLNESAVILYSLHEIFGFGAERLKRFFMNYEKTHRELCEWYEMNAETDGHDIASYLSKLQLKRIGVDFDAWMVEINEAEEHDKDGQP